MQPQKGLREIGAVHQRRAQLRQVGAAFLEQRILKRGAQVGQHRGRVALGDVAPVDAVGV